MSEYNRTYIYDVRIYVGEEIVRTYSKVTAKDIENIKKKMKINEDIRYSLVGVKS